MAKRRRKAAGFSVRLQERLAAVLEERSIRDVATETEYSPSQLSRFVRGQRGLATGPKLDRLVEAVGMRCDG